MKVPFLDLKAQYMSIKEEIGAALERVPADTIVAGNPARIIRAIGADDAQIPNSKLQMSNNIK
jgi:hypothetical protein